MRNKNNNDNDNDNGKDDDPPPLLSSTIDGNAQTTYLDLLIVFFGGTCEF